MGDRLKNVLDVGTGTGIWATEFGEWLYLHRVPTTYSVYGDVKTHERGRERNEKLISWLILGLEHPGAHVTGIDLSPIQPS